MILAVDVHYEETEAMAAGVLFSAWDACEPDAMLLTHLSGVADYEPGYFYRRELPCVLALLAQVDPLPHTIVIDGYVYLGSEQQPGLGKHLYDALNGRIPIIGVAKTYYKGTPAATELCRGRSQRPLYVTAVGVEQTAAKQAIQQMCGSARLPDLLKRVDQLCRGKIPLRQ
ncbi:MAG: endonuclease V [Anaerolineales bacterium]|nr:endonuclease V [Anaerolineales bacterium]